jgi:integrase
MVQESFGNPSYSISRNEKEAQDYAKLVERVGGGEARKILAAHSNKTAGTPTLAEFTARYLDPASGLLTGIEPGTRQGYERISRSFLPMLGDYPINSITPSDVGRWISWQEGQPSGKFAGQLIAAKTVRNYHALLSNIFRLAIEQGYRPDNPAYKTRLSKGVPREGVFLSRDEFAALYNAIPDYYKPLVAFLAGSQLRWSEATALTGADLNRDTTPPTVRVNKAWKKNPDGPPVLGPPKTQAGRRTVAIWPVLMDLIGTPPTPNDFVFRGRQSGRRIWYGMFNTKIWHPAVERSGIAKKPLPHDLRHTGASWLIADGMPMYEIQHRLGHEDERTTSRVYGHLDPGTHTRMSASLEAIMSNVLPIKNLEA